MLRDQQIITPQSFAFNFFAYGTVIAMFVATYVWTGMAEFMQENKVWKIFFGFIGDPYPTLFTGRIILLIIISVKNIKNTLPRLERVYSTVYIVVDVILHQILISLLFFVWFYIRGPAQLSIHAIIQDLKTLFSLDWELKYILGSATWLTLLQIFIVRVCRESPDQISDYLFIPMRRKFIPWIHLMFSMMVFGMKTQMLLTTAFAYFQVFLLRFNLVIRLPLFFYGIIQKFTPRFIKLSDGFVLIQQCFYDRLKTACKFCIMDRSYIEYEEQLRRSQATNPRLRQAWGQQNQQQQQQQRDNQQEEPLQNQNNRQDHQRND